MGLDEHATEDGAAELAEPVVDALEEALGGLPQLGVGVVVDEGAAGGPDGGVRDALHELEGQDEPRPRDEGDVEEAEAVAQEAGSENLKEGGNSADFAVRNCDKVIGFYLDVSVFGDDLEGVKVGGHLGHVVDDGGDAEEGGAAAKVLEVPEEEGEDQPDPDAHHPGGQHED